MSKIFKLLDKYVFKRMTPEEKKIYKATYNKEYPNAAKDAIEKKAKADAKRKARKKFESNE
jgi:hypothetical protein